MTEHETEQWARISHEVNADNLQDLVWQIHPMDVLEALVNGLQKKKDDNNGELSRDDDKRHCELIDLMLYVERTVQGGQLPCDVEMPECDQFTLIERQMSEGLISNEAGNDLKRELLDQFEQATSPDTPATEQYRQVYDIMRTFNPARKLTCG